MQFADEAAKYLTDQVAPTRIPVVEDGSNNPRSKRTVLPLHQAHAHLLVNIRALSNPLGGPDSRNFISENFSIVNSAMRITEESRICCAGRHLAKRVY